MLTSTGMRARRSRTTFGVAIATENVRQNTGLQSAVFPDRQSLLPVRRWRMAKLAMEEARHELGRGEAGGLGNVPELLIR